MKKEKLILLSSILLLFCVAVTICGINSVKASNKDNTGSLTVQILGPPLGSPTSKDVLDVIQVSSRGAIVKSIIALQDKVSYDIVVSGVYYTGGGSSKNAHDAMYVTQNDWSTYTNDQNGLYIDRWVVGSKQWGAYNSEHIYRYTIVGNGTEVSFRIYDPDTPSNSSPDTPSNSTDNSSDDSDTLPTFPANSPNTSQSPDTIPATEKSNGLFENTFVIVTALIVTVIVVMGLLLFTRSKNK
jgi:hypothetical protein